MFIDNLLENRLSFFIPLLLLFVFGLFIIYSGFRIRKTNQNAAAFVIVLGTVVILVSLYLLVTALVF
ncbi:hypothetical protein SAMN04488102_1186 [Alkalibacterium subtropicum]|uniref:Uncharacterized protein n=1 Tax=Alkalibacterium subtropicum TaxID=753702 RepID=A0A1I1L465_9LACT|nr:hypothetical protein [Alkalibacterium subtropicum]SFC67824.1 hypothetical protein SAMN04488102_1186 [Alkalibacterium subtropicum]